MFRISLGLVGWIVLLASSASPSRAGFVQINSVERGFYTSTGSHTPGSDNYSVGSSDAWRNFLVFDLTSIDPGETILSASVRLLNPTADWFTNAATYSLFDVSTPISTLTDGTAGVAAFNDLGSGTLLGSQVIPAGSGIIDPLASGLPVVVTLNATAVAALNASIGGVIAFGGRLDSPTASYAFGFTGSGNPADGGTFLRIELQSAPVIPEPNTVIAFSIGLVCLVGFVAVRGRRSDRTTSVA